MGYIISIMTDYIVVNRPSECDIQEDYINDDEIYKLFTPETQYVEGFYDRDFFEHNKAVIVGSNDEQRVQLVHSLLNANDYDKLIIMDPTEEEAQRYNPLFPDAEFYDYDETILDDVIIEQYEDNTRIVVVFDNIDVSHNPGYLSSSGTFRSLMDSGVTILILQTDASKPFGDITYFVATSLQLVFVLREEKETVRKSIFNRYCTMSMGFPTFDEFSWTLLAETDPDDFVNQVTHTTPCLVMNYKTQTFESYDFNNKLEDFPLTESSYSESSHSESSIYQEDYLQVLDELVNVLNETNRTLVDDVVDFVYYAFCSCLRP